MKIILQVLERQLEILEERKQKKSTPKDIKRVEKHMSEIKIKIKELSKKD